MEKHHLNPQFLIGVDEVGRGCLAGPVAVGLTLWRHTACSAHQHPPWLWDVKDSKVLSAEKRKNISDRIWSGIGCEAHNQVFSPEISMAEILENKNRAAVVSEKPMGNSAHKFSFEFLNCAVGIATPGEIDQWNIWNAVILAANRGLSFLFEKYPIHLNNTLLFFDGKIPLKFHPRYVLNQVTVIKGDTSLASAATAGIIAKVYRDDWMTELGTTYPIYEFSSHKGYATKKHRQHILQQGTLRGIHRLSFIHFP